MLQYCFCFFFFFYVLVFWPWDKWNLSSLSRDQTRTPCNGRPSLNHWTTKEVLAHLVSTKSFTQIPNHLDCPSPGGGAGVARLEQAQIFLPSSICTWVWANSGRWWGTGESGVLQSMGSQRVGHPWVTEHICTEVQKGVKVKGRRSGCDSRPSLTFQSWRGPHSGNSPTSSKSIQAPKDRTRDLGAP